MPLLSKQAIPTPSDLSLCVCVCVYSVSFVRHSLKQAQNYLKERPGINETDIDTQVHSHEYEGGGGGGGADRHMYTFTATNSNRPHTEEIFCQQLTG